MRSVLEGRRTRALDNGVTRNGTRRAAKCIMPRRRLQWASGGVHNGAKRGVALRSIHLAFVFFLFFFSFSSLAPFTAQWRYTQVKSTTALREKPIHEIYRGNRSVTLQREQTMAVTASYTRYVIVHHVSRMTLEHDDESPSKRHFTAIHRLTTFSETPSTRVPLHYVQSSFVTLIIDWLTMVIELHGLIRCDIGISFRIWY